MLKQIMTEFRLAGRPLCQDELSRKLAINPAALEGMLQTLVHRGRLLAIPPLADGCAACPVKGGCVILRADGQTHYVLSPQFKPTPIW